MQGRSPSSGLVSPSRTLLALVLGIAGLAFAAPPASADDFFVNSNGDIPDETLDGICDTVGGLCTLRAAIQEANNETDNPGPDTITLSGIVFIGSGNVIDIGATDLPAIAEPVSISCQSTPVSKPCAQIDSPPGNGLTVNADDVSIHGVAVTNALQGIAVFDPLGTGTITGFDLEHSWLGITLAETDGSNATGLFLDAGVDGASIGGTTAGARNVFGFNTLVGLRITGADDNSVQGNYFGVLASGSTQAAQPTNIAINSADLTVDNLATGNTIGGELSPDEQTSPECDGPCNVISGGTSGSAAGIELHQNMAFGNLPAGSTTIKGNYFGLSHDASALVPNFGTSIAVGFADNITIGTGGPAGANRINGGGFGIAALSGSDNLEVSDNRIGVNFGETASLGPPSFGMVLHSTGGAPTSATDNRVSAAVGAVGIDVQGSNATIAGNNVGLGSGGQPLTLGTGVRLINATGTTIDSNTIVNAAADAVRVQGGTGNLLVGNSLGLLGTGNTGPGVRILNGATGTIVGSDTPADFNDISGNLGGAVVIEGATTDDNSVLGNTGAGSTGLFIDLGADGPGATTGANEDIQAPAISTADDQSASGTAAPGATVRLFAKSSAANSEIADLLGTAVAGVGGDWEIAYGSVPDFVGATQTLAGDGTSEMAVEAVVLPPDVDAPQTTITKKPKKKTAKTKAKFKFESSEAGSTFECKFDKKPFKPCSSPFKKKRLKPKKHKFLVRATDAAGNTDQTPAKAKFKVLR